MPIYEYQCTACGFEKEVLQKMSDEPLTVCEECGKASMIKKVSAAGFRLKGGGWYETDFKSGSKKNVHNSDDKKSSTKSKDTAKSSSSSKPSSKKA